MATFDASIHFTTKDQSLETIKSKFNDWARNNKHVINLVDTPNFGRLHHCFMKKADSIKSGHGTKVYDFLSEYHSICWNGATESYLLKDREDMLGNLKRVNGVAIFVGDIRGAVKEELALAELIGVDIVKIK